MKRLWLAAAFLAALIAPAYPYGTINLSLSQQFDSKGVPLSGGKLYLFQAGTTTPQSAYQDTALTLPLPNPITLDASGRISQFFLADGNIKFRLDDRNGVTVISADNILVIGPSSGSSSGGTVDPTTILATGDMKLVYGTGSLSGFVRANGRTIGSATSGATERASSDAQALFQDLWNQDANLVVSGGHGASAAADWAANKTIALPDLRGRMIAGLDDMGNTSAARLNTLSSTTLGASGGAQAQTASTTLGTGNIPQFTFTPSGAVNISTAIGTNFIAPQSGGPAGFSAASGPVGLGSVGGIASFSGSAISIGNASPSAAVSASFPTLPPVALMTIYIKL